MADSLLADYILESTGYLSALSKTLPAIYPLYQRPYQLSILSIKDLTSYLSSLSKTLPAIYPLYQRPYQLSILSIKDLTSYLSSLSKTLPVIYPLPRENTDLPAVYPPSESTSLPAIYPHRKYHLFILLGKLKSPLQVHTYSIILNGVLKFKFNKSRPQFRLTLSSS
jgi:hypothetical protein